MQNSRGKFSISLGSEKFSGKKYECFSAKLNYKKVQPQIYPGPTQFGLAPYVLCGQNFGPLATLLYTRN
jgi:hypothetical protein